MSQNIPDESQTTAEQPSGADLLEKMSESTAALIEAQEKLVKVAADVAKHTTDPNAHGAATLANIIKALPTPVLEDGMFSFKDADGNDIIAPVNLKGETGEKGEQGDNGAKGDKGDMPDHQWNGTSLQLQKPDGTWGEAQDLRGPKGEDGTNGTDGAPGQAPDHQWDGTSLQIQNPDGSWGESKDLQGPKGDSGDAAVATDEQPGIVQPDGGTLQVDEAGLLTALGGNLQFNDELWLTVSGTWIAPVTGWYEVFCINGGGGGSSRNMGVITGATGGIKIGYAYLEEGEAYDVVIGVGGVGLTGAYVGDSCGGETNFSGLIDYHNIHGFPRIFKDTRGDGIYRISGQGPGGAVPVNFGDEERMPEINASWYGSTGAAVVEMVQGNYRYMAGNGYQGAVRLRFWNPAKANGPAPALFAARRMARTAAAPAVVNLYDPETGQGSVWRAEDAEAKRASGLITESAWLAICAEKAAEEHAAWLANPDTEAERFAMLRWARDAKLAATDYLVAPDYPLSDAQRAAVTAYRQALRDLPAQEGAPWDGGGELTPWPEAPTVGPETAQPEEPEQTEEGEV